MKLKLKIIVPLLIIAIVAMSTLTYVSASGISTSLTAQQGGVDVTSAPQGATIQLVSSFTISPSALGKGTVSYRYSADSATYGPLTTITTYNNWDGSERTEDFTLTQIGSYVFFITVESGFNSATTTYPSTGTFSSNPPSVLPESPPIIAALMGVAAIALFVGVTKRRSHKAATAQ